MRRDRYRSPSYSTPHRSVYASRRRRHNRYEPLTSADAEAGAETSLVYTVSIEPGEHGLSNKGNTSLGSESQSWYRRRTSLEVGIDTELLVINAAESITVDRGESAVRLYCQENALDNSVSGAASVSPNQMRWL